MDLSNTRISEIGIEDSTLECMVRRATWHTARYAMQSEPLNITGRYNACEDRRQQGLGNSLHFLFEHDCKRNSRIWVSRRPACSN